MDGLSIALQRIAQEAEERTGFLDLGRLALKTPPSELFTLKHLRQLSLGHFYDGRDGRRRESASSLGQNSVAAFVALLVHLPELQTLWLSRTDLSDVIGIAGIVGLREVDCSSTEVSDLTPLKSLPNLQSLTRVSDLTPLQDLPSLQSLDCSDTQVSDLTPLKDLPSLQSLNCSQCRLSAVATSFWMKSSLTEVILHETHLPDIPIEVLSQTPHHDCLAPLRAHLHDLEAGNERVPDLKLMVLGNGRVGKTQICRRLRDQDFDANIESTHGILVTSAPLPLSQGGETARLQIWDFGGQDIYHGTHALFMRSRAIFAVVWIPDAEKIAEHRHGGFVFRNQPLAYWLEYIRHFSGTDSPVVIIQTRCDTAEDEQVRPPISDEVLSALRPPPKIIHYSAQTNRGRPSLDDALSQSVEWIGSHEGVAFIGAGRAKVKRQIENMRDEDAARPPLERKHRTITNDHFLQLCRKAGGISEPEHLLNYLHNAGTVFYRKGLFENRIIVDQSWALESIYAVFHREKCYGKLLRQNGRFTRADIDEWTWQEAGHGIEEQKLLLSMMESCGICFQHRPASRDGRVEAEYIAPDLLPQKPDSGVLQKWDGDRAIVSAEFTYALLTPALMRGIISRVGGEAGIEADYWRDGVYVYEETTGSRGLIEQKMTGLWQGQITIQTQRGQAVVLLERLVKLVEEEQGRIGLASSGKPPAQATGTMGTTHSHDEPKAPAALKFTQEPAQTPEYFVSYAWGDSTPEGRARENIVDRLCVAAEERNISILRDKKILGLGERISKFIQRLGRADRVFIVLSDKYLKSPYCMYELFEVWRNCRRDDQEFLDRIRVFMLPDARIWSPLERAQCAVHWKEGSGKLEAIVNQHGYNILGRKDYQHYKLMKDFSHHIGDILETITDILQPRSFEELEKYGFDQK